jgi:hypothetical protein
VLSLARLTCSLAIRLSLLKKGLTQIIGTHLLSAIGGMRQFFTIMWKMI